MPVLGTVARHGPIYGANGLMDHSCHGDDTLLQAFLDTRDQAAFAELVQRHGAMVFGVCRRILRCRHDAEDAFQATFLVLARRAQDVKPRQHVGRWLHGVAWRVASRARREVARRAASPLQEVAAPSVAQANDVRDILDEELAMLPEVYLAPVVLCDLEGRTYRDAARHLGLPVATLSNRLTAARRALARRLLRRGVECPSAGVLPVVAALKEVIPAPLMDTASNASALAGLHSPLADGVIRTMLLSNLAKKASAIVALLAVALGGVLLLASAVEDKNLKELAGEWTVVKAVRSGKQLPDNERKAMKVTVKGSQMTIQTGSRKEVSKIELDPSTTPKSINIAPVKRRETELGIYKRDGDQLTICWGAARPGERQQKFEAPKGSGGYLLILKRLSAEKP